MKIGVIRKKIDEVLDTYRNLLDIIPDEQFELTPPDGSWSYAEIYSHILQADISSTIALEKCTLASCVKTSKGRTLAGLVVLSFGRFPRVNAPAQVAAIIPAKKISKEDAKNLIVKCRKRVDTVAPLIHDSSKYARIQHPRLGMLNAKQWFKFILIHSKHHLKQLDRIKKKLSTQ